MRDSGSGEEDSTVVDPRPGLWPKVFCALALFGLLCGLMLGRLSEPAPVRLLRVEVAANSLVLHFDGEPQVYAERPGGTLELLFESYGREAEGGLQVEGRPANWRLMHTERGLLLQVVAARALRGQLAGSAEDQGWRIEVRLQLLP